MNDPTTSPKEKPRRMTKAVLNMPQFVATPCCQCGKEPPPVGSRERFIFIHHNVVPLDQMMLIAGRYLGRFACGWDCLRKCQGPS